MNDDFDPHEPTDRIGVRWCVSCDVEAPCKPRIEDLVERSSLGTPEAKTLRASVSDEQVAKVMQRYRLLAAADEIRGERMREQTGTDSAVAEKIDAAFEVLTDRESRDWKSIDEAAAYLRRITNGAAHLGRIVAFQNADALAAIGNPPDLIGEDGDGDWAVVWERLAELRPERDAAAAARNRARLELAEANKYLAVAIDLLLSKYDDPWAHLMAAFKSAT